MCTPTNHAQTHQNTDAHLSSATGFTDKLPTRIIGTLMLSEISPQARALSAAHALKHADSRLSRIKRDNKFACSGAFMS
jgi:hypothetical protein